MSSAENRFTMSVSLSSRERVSPLGRGWKGVAGGECSKGLDRFGEKWFCVWAEGNPLNGNGWDAIDRV